MHNQSPFVKVVIWLMIFLMSIGFVALVITPFLGGGSFFGDDSGRGATEELVQEARADIEKDDCTDTKDRPTGKRLDRCKEALTQLASSYTTLASPDETTGESPRDAQRNIDRSLDAKKALYELDEADDDSAELYASGLREAGKAKQSLEIWTRLVKENPDEEDYLLQQAVAYQGTQETDKAIATFKAFVKKFPESGQVEAINEQIKTLQEQAKQEAANKVGTPGAAGAGNLPITVG